MKRKLTPEEKLLWQKVTRYDRKLHSNKTDEASLPEQAMQIAVKKNISAPPVPLPQVMASPLRKGSYANIDRNTADTFRKGDYPIDATLDLHGLHREEAFVALYRFIQSHAAKQHRCLLVITGKGAKKDGESNGVLREALPHWLDVPELRAVILTYDNARPKHGGSGAFYILLKRKRGHA